jgi:hypothetical protein
MKEIEKNRFVLWNSALSSARRNLFLSKQIDFILANYKNNLSKKHTKNLTFNNSFILIPNHTLVDKDKFLEGEILYKNHYDNKIENLEFGDSSDLKIMKDNLKILSIIYFCKLLNTGYSIDKGGYNKTVRDKYFEEIETFSIPEEFIEEYKKMKEILLDKRDSVFAHDDLDKFNIERHENGVSFWTYSKFLDGIDFDFFDDCMRWLQGGIGYCEYNVF